MGFPQQALGFDSATALFQISNYTSNDAIDTLQN